MLDAGSILLKFWNGFRISFLTTPAAVLCNTYFLEAKPVPEEQLLPPMADQDQGTEIQIHATIRVRISAKKRQEARVILGAMIEQTTLEEGCVFCRLYQDVMAKGVFMLEEIWTSDHALHRHLRSEKFRNVLLVIEMATEAPEIRFHRVLQSTGISTIKKARSGLYI
jgi:quinol monooxygenase YgiN